MNHVLTSITILALLLFVVTPYTAQAKIISVVSGGEHALALNDDGTVLAWGANADGQLGIGTMSDDQANPQIVHIDNVTAITAFGTHSLALKEDGTVWAWGCGLYGALGYGGDESQSTPVQVLGLTNIIAISHNGGDGIALKDDGTVWMWGCNKYGGLGDGTTVDRWTPVQVKELTDIIALGEGGSGGSFAIKQDGTVWAWGNNNYDDATITFGALGDTSGPGLRLTPIQLKGLSNIKQITKGQAHTAYLKDDGTVWSWGGNRYGEIGDGTINNEGVKTNIDGIRLEVIKNTPVQLKLNDIVQLSAAWYHTIALKSDGTVWFWGNYLDCTAHNNEYGAPAPTKVEGLENVVDISSGDQCCLALKKDGSVWGWGDNHNKVLRDHSKYESTPVLLIKGSPATTPMPAATPITIATSNSSAILNTSQDTTKLTTVTSVTPATTPGLGFNSMALLGCLFIIVGLLSGVVRRKYR